MIKRSFQHTAFFLWPVNSPSSKDVHSGALYRNINLQLHPTTTLFPKVSSWGGPMAAHSPLFVFKTPHTSKFSWPWVKQNKKTTKTNTTQFAVSLFHDRGLTHVKDLRFTHESFMLLSLLGLRRPFLRRRVFCSKFACHFWLHKGRF